MSLGKISRIKMRIICYYSFSVLPSEEPSHWPILSRSRTNFLISACRSASGRNVGVETTDSHPFR